MDNVAKHMQRVGRVNIQVNMASTHVGKVP